MAWELVGVSSVATVTAASHTLSEPSGVQQGDLLVAAISRRSTDVEPVRPPCEVPLYTWSGTLSFGSGGNTANPVYYCQSFLTPGGGLTVRDVALRMAWSGTPPAVATMVCEICSGSPNGTVVATSDTVDVSSAQLGTQYQDILFTFASPPSLSASTTYYLVFIRSSLAAAASLNVRSNLGVYANGEGYIPNQTRASLSPFGAGGDYLVGINSGWRQAGEQLNNNTATNTSATPSGGMWYCIRGASAPPLEFTHFGTPSVAMGAAVAYRGGDTSSPLDVANSATTGTNVTSINQAVGVTTNQGEDLLVVARCGGQESTISGWAAATDPTSASGATTTTAGAIGADAWRERFDQNTTTGADTSLTILDAVKTSAGATGNMTGTASQGSAHAIIVAAFKLGASGSDTPVSVDASLAAGASVVRQGGKRVVPGIAASMAFGARSVGKLANAGAALAASCLKAVTAPVSVGVTAAPAISKGTAKRTTVSLAAASAASKGAGKALSADAALTASILAVEPGPPDPTASPFGSGPFGSGPFGPRPQDGTTNYPQEVNASIALSAAITKNAGKQIAAGVDLTALLGAKAASKLISPGIDLAAAQIKAVTKAPFQIGADAACAAVKTVGKSVAADGVEVGTPSISVSVGKLLNAGLALAASFVKAVAKAVTAGVDLAASVATGIPVLVEAGIAAAVSVTKQVGKLAISGIAASAAISRSVGKLVNAAGDAAAACAKGVGKILAAGVSLAAVATTGIPVLVEAGIAAAASVTKEASKQIAALASVLAGAVVRSVGKAVSAGTDLAASFVKAVAKAVAAGIEALADIFNGQPVLISIGLSAGASVTKAATKQIAALATALAAISKAVGKLILPGLTAAASAVKAVARTVSVGIELLSNTTQGFPMLVVVGLQAGASLTRSVAKRVLAPVSAAAQTILGVAVTLAAAGLTAAATVLTRINVPRLILEGYHALASLLGQRHSNQALVSSDHRDTEILGEDRRSVYLVGYKSDSDDLG